jgi:predicted extracellular nuclease
VNKRAWAVVGLITALLFSVSFSRLVIASPDNELGRCGDGDYKNTHSISDIQGNGFSSPLLGRWVVVEGIVTRALQGRDQYRGFWLQQPDSSKIANNYLKKSSNNSSDNYSNNSQDSSSKGLFVYHDSQSVKPGQRVRLFAQVAEHKGLTEVKKVKAIIVCASGIALPKAVSITLPVTSLLQLEAKEGMRIILPQELVISDLHGAGYGLGNYGQFAVSSQLHSQPTELWTAAQLRSGKVASLQKKELDYLLIDDGSAKAFPTFIPYPTVAGFSADNPIRVSDRVAHVEGILHAYDDHYLVIPDNIAAISIQAAYPRTNSPAIANASNLIVVSMNLGNYFNGALENKKKKNKGFPTARGAKSMAGFTLQTEKIVSALMATDADIIAVMEVENDGYGTDSAISSLTHALNEKIKPSSTSQYQYIKPLNRQLTRGKLGRDVIAVGLLYRPHIVSLSGAARVLDSSSSKDLLFDDRRNRPSLIQTFKFNQHEFVIAVNHFKAKGRPCNDIEVDTLQGNCNITRYRAALALAEFLKQSDDSKLPTLILGDLNAYSQEEPLLALYAAGFENLKYAAQFLNNDQPSNNNQPSNKTQSMERVFPSFSYSFRGLLGNLDHALANAALLPFIQSVDSWHINSLEDVLLDYSTEENGHKHPSVDTYGSPDRYRSSDHDPVVLGLQFPEASSLN